MLGSELKVSKSISHLSKKLFGKSVVTLFQTKYL